jgi:hypothetical protein
MLKSVVYQIKENRGRTFRLTGVEIQKLILDGQELTITASRLSGNRYGVGVQFANGDFAGPVTLPESDQPLQFDSLDEVASFLSQVGIDRLQVSLKE